MFVFSSKKSEEVTIMQEYTFHFISKQNCFSADGKRIRIPGHKLLSNRMARCVTNVEAFILRAADLEEVTSLFCRFLRNPRVQGALR